MLSPVSRTFIAVQPNGPENVFFVPKVQIQFIRFNRDTETATLDLQDRPPVSFTDTEKNIRRVLTWRDT